MEQFSLQTAAQLLVDKKAQVAASVAKLQMEANCNLIGFYDDLLQRVHILMASVGISNLDSYLQQEIARTIDFYQIPLEKEINQAFNLQDIFPFAVENQANTPPPTSSSLVLENSLQVIGQKLFQKKGQVDANLEKLRLEVAYLINGFYNYLIQRMNILVAAGGSIPNPILYLQEEIVKASTRYQVPLMLALTEAFNLQAVFSVENGEHGQQQASSQAGTSSAAGSNNQMENAANSGLSGSTGGGQVIPNQEEMSGDVQENAQQLAEQQMVNAQYSSPPPAPSPPNAEQSINSLEFNSGNQIDLYDNESANADEIGHADAADDTDGDLEDEEHVDNSEIEENDRQESDDECSMIDEENAGEESDHFEEQATMSYVEEIDNEEEIDEDYLVNDEESSDDDAEMEQAAGPSISTGRRSTEKLSVITKKLKCTVPGCKEAVKSKNAINRHLLSAHKLRKYRCLVRRCHGKVSTSFSTRSQFTDHLDQVHGGATRWKCHCGKKFNNYPELCSHYWRYHQLGRFACSKDGCTFKPAKTRGAVFSHQAKHREAKYQCPVDGCGKSFTQKGNLTIHLRIHRNDKCFRCIWPGCTHSAVNSGNVITHIRMVHFKLPATKKKQAEAEIEDDRDPRDYLARD